MSITYRQETLDKLAARAAVNFLKHNKYASKQDLRNAARRALPYGASEYDKVFAVRYAVEYCKTRQNY